MMLLVNNSSHHCYFFSVESLLLLDSQTISLGGHPTTMVPVENGWIKVHCVQAWRRGQFHNDLEVYVVVDGVNTCKSGCLTKTRGAEGLVQW